MKIVAAFGFAASLLCFVACSPLVSKPVTLTTSERARIVMQIVIHLRESPPEITVTPVDLRTQGPLLTTLRNAGVVRGSSFSAKGVKASRLCPDQSVIAGARCFPIGRYRFVDLISAVETPRTIDHEATRSYLFGFRAIPQGAIAESLAKSRVLVCDRVDGTAQSWSGPSTRSVGSFSQDADLRYPKLDVTFVACPQTAATFAEVAHIP